MTMWNEYNKIILANLAAMAPVLLALVVGLGLALVERRRGSASSIWAAIGFGLQLTVEISRAFASILTITLNVEHGLSMAPVGMITFMVSFALNLLSAAAWSMIIAALFFQTKTKA